MHGLFCINGRRATRRPPRALNRSGAHAARKSDDKTFRLPLARDLSSELSGHGRPDKKLAESVIADRGSDRRPAELCPINDDGSRTSSAVNLDLPGSRGKRAIFHGICREFVQQQCEAREHRPRNLHIATNDRRSASLVEASTVALRHDQLARRSRASDLRLRNDRPLRAASLLQNARRHSRAQIKQIAKSIEAFGFTNPILVSTNWRSLRVTGAPRRPC